MEKPRRQRIAKTEGEVVEDAMEFKANCASENAQCLHTYDELKVELWCDKHYHHRRTFGDSSGEREGIEIDGVQELIIKSFKYLLDIYLRGVPFKFINYFDPLKPEKKKERVVLKEVLEDGVLNIVAEIHYLDTSQFEMTIITAMKTDDFNVADGQYSLRISNKRVLLNRMVRKSMNTVHQLDL